MAHQSPLHPAVAGVERAGGAGQAPGGQVAERHGRLHLVAQHDQSGGSIDPYDLNRFHGNAESLNYPQSVAITVIYQLPFFQHTAMALRRMAAGRMELRRHHDLPQRNLADAGPERDRPGLALRPGPGAGSDTWTAEDLEEQRHPISSGSTPSAFACPGVATTTAPATAVPSRQRAMDSMATPRRASSAGRARRSTTWPCSRPSTSLEKAHLEFRAEAFNTFNHTNPSNPNTSLGNANYGKITGALTRAFWSWRCG